MAQHAPRKPPQAETPDKHPEEYLRDLNPTALAGQNIGITGEHPEKEPGRSAYDIKEAHRLLHWLSADDLKEIRVLPPGMHLEQGATYLDLCHPETGEFKATAGMMTSDAHWIVPKKEVNYELWNRLRGVHGVKRTGTEG